MTAILTNFNVVFIYIDFIMDS